MTTLASVNEISSGRRTLTDDDTAIVAAKLHDAHFKFSCELLAHIAPEPFKTMPIVQGDPLNVTVNHFGDIGTRLIFSCMDLARDKTEETRFRLCREGLIRENLWEDDDRPYISGLRWSPGSLATLFTRIKFDANKCAVSATRLLCAFYDLQDFESLHRKAGAR